MKAVLVIEKTPVSILTRDLDFVQFKETLFSQKSFADPGLFDILQEGSYYTIHRNPKNSWKIELVQPREGTRDIEEYEGVLHRLSLALETQSDPITMLRRDAAKLKFLKGKRGSFFSDEKAVFQWLLKKHGS